MLLHDVDARAGPIHVAPRRVALVELLQLGRVDESGGEHFALDGIRRVGPLAELEVKRPGVGRGHPVHVRGLEAGLECEVIHGRHADEFSLVLPRLQLERHARALAHHHTVEEHAVPRGRDAGDERGVVRPGDGGVGDGHRLGHRALARELLEEGHRQRRVVPNPGREAVNRHQHDDAVLGGNIGGEGGDERSQQGEEKRGVAHYFKFVFSAGERFLGDLLSPF